ncbi:hypothetical protein NPIL_38101, partial [Nephila pilipes]
INCYFYFHFEIIKVQLWALIYYLRIIILKEIQEIEERGE